MSVGIVTGNAIAEPQDVFDTVELMQILLDLFLREFGITVCIQETRGRGENCSLPLKSTDPPSMTMEG